MELSPLNAIKSQLEHTTAVYKAFLKNRGGTMRSFNDLREALSQDGQTKEAVRALCLNFLVPVTKNPAEAEGMLPTIEQLNTMTATDAKNACFRPVINAVKNIAEGFEAFEAHIAEWIISLKIEYREKASKLENPREETNYRP